MTGRNSISPEEARDWYIEDRDEELSEATLRSHKYRLSMFLKWCDATGIEHMDELTGRHFSKYKIARKNSDGNPNNVTLNTQLSTLRVFIKWCGKRELVPRDLYEYVDPPRMAPKEDVRPTMLDAEEAADILRHYRKFEYATRDHVIIELLWSVGMREGALRAIDMDDYVPEPTPSDEAEGPYIKIRHRPETETPLKNGERGERDVALKPGLVELLNDYIENNRWPREDEHGRNPFITTRWGRISITTLRKAVYGMTRPCAYSGRCPHDKEIGECDYATNVSVASKCPTTVSPHAVRKGAITWARRNDIPLEAISERMDVSPEVLRKHYDRRTTQQKMESRRSYFDRL